MNYFYNGNLCFCINFFFVFMQVLKKTNCDCYYLLHDEVQKFRFLSISIHLAGQDIDDYFS